YVDNQYLQVPLRGPGAVEPFVFTIGEDADGNGDGLSCSEVGILQYDREEGAPTEDSDGFSPPPPQPGAPPVPPPAVAPAPGAPASVPGQPPPDRAAELQQRIEARRREMREQAEKLREQQEKSK
ncbi:hypothetical protein NM961_06420, partial [Tahibacter sp. P2K]|nr:hypothetical protein [Tahibacter harae]